MSGKELRVTGIQGKSHKGNWTERRDRWIAQAQPPAAAQFLGCFRLDKARLLQPRLTVVRVLKPTGKALQSSTHTGLLCQLMAAEGAKSRMGGRSTRRELRLSINYAAGRWR